MSIDPRTPVIIGVGQALQREASFEDALDPSALMAEAVRAAATDAGLAALPKITAFRVIGLLSWKYHNVAWNLAQHFGQDPQETAVTCMGGNTPQLLMNATCMDISRGVLDIAVLTGAEVWRTRMRARKQGVTLPWPTERCHRSPRLLGRDKPMISEAEQARGIVMPVQVYPMFETAIRAAAGRSVDEHNVLVSELWQRFNAVAVDNPYAWVREPKTAEEIRTPGPSNRMVGYPYTKYLNSNNDVDMSAAVIVCSAAKAEELGVSRDLWVFPWSGADCAEHEFISDRWSFAETPAIELGGRTALDLVGLTIDDIDIVDLYSCFPSAVQLGAQSLGLSLDRQLTRTGGLTWAGGPWNNYVMHAIATTVRDLREGAGQKALVWANGGYVSKHSFGVYGIEPCEKMFRATHPQAKIDELPKRSLAAPADAAGPATIEAYTVMHSRDGEPERVFAACLLADERRAWGVSSAADLAAAMCEGEWVGRAATLDAEGTLLV